MGKGKKMETQKSTFRYLDKPKQDQKYE